MEDTNDIERPVDRRPFEPIVSHSCSHAWETVEQCFECGAIRPKQPEKDIFHEDERQCPVD